jgi:hypothetical protein
MRLTALSIALIAALPAAAAPAVKVQPGPQKSFVFVLKGIGSEVLCTSGPFQSQKKALKGAEAAKQAGASLKNYLFQKTEDAQGVHHFWELREAKRHKEVLCRSTPVAEQEKAEQSAGAATKAFTEAPIAL